MLAQKHAERWNGNLSLIFHIYIYIFLFNLFVKQEWFHLHLMPSPAVSSYLCFHACQLHWQEVMCWKTSLKTSSQWCQSENYCNIQRGDSAFLYIRMETAISHTIMECLSHYDLSVTSGTGDQHEEVMISPHRFPQDVWSHANRTCVNGHTPVCI